MGPVDKSVGPKKRMADGELKDANASVPPVYGHSRNTSAVSAVSSTASTLGEVSRLRPQPSLSPPRGGG